MAGTLTADNLTKLLDSLDADRERAGERYEEIRRTLIRFFEWRGAPFSEEQTDEVFDRVARKLGEGVEIRNINGYCYEVARLVLLEALKGKDKKSTPLDSVSPPAVNPDDRGEFEDREARLSCLDQCLASLSEDGRRLIVGYYQEDKGDRINRRRSLAESLRIPREALANRAQRLREKLEYCVRQCLR